MKIKINEKEFNLEDENILANDVIFPWELNPHNVRLFLIGDEFGPICAIWASCLQDALDEMVDANLGDRFLINEEDIKDYEKDDLMDSITYLGNTSEPADLEELWTEEIDLGEQTIPLLCKFAEARGGCYDHLNF